MRISLLTAVASAALVGGTASADVLTTGNGDGQVTLNVDAFGDLGSGSDRYNPVGAGTAATTIFGSRLYVGVQGSSRSALTGTLVSFTGNNTSRTSVFSYGDFSVTLVQSVVNQFDNNGQQSGSLLSQAYSFTNTSNSSIVLDIVRYLDGDLRFDGSLIDGGGRLVSGGNEILFETDSATGANDNATFVGIYNTGGVASGYQIGEFSSLRTRSGSNLGLANTIMNDGNSNGFIDAGRGYDVELALRNLLTVGAGGTNSFTTYTIFGTGAPAAVVVPPVGGAVPEPATWAMMIAGFGLVGAGMRRRRSSVRFA